MVCCSTTWPLVRHGAQLLARAETQLLTRDGAEGLQLVGDILGSGMTIEGASAARDDTGKSRIEWWGGLFRSNRRANVHPRIKNGPCTANHAG
jgi:hypothetical protein